MKYEIGPKIRYYRELHGLTQKELADKIGMSNARLSNWEQGLNRPDVDSIIQLCLALDISADKLLGITVFSDELSEEERKIISRYRQKSDLQQAVRILLGIND